MKHLIFILFPLCLFLSCEKNSSEYDESINGNDEHIADNETNDDEISFNFSTNARVFNEKTVRDSVSCNGMIFVCGESDGVAYLTGFKDGQEKWHIALDDHTVQSINVLACGKTEESGFLLFAGGDRSMKKDSPQTGFLMSLLPDTGKLVSEVEIANGNSVSVYALVVDSDLNVYAGGRVDGAFEGTEELGGKDGFIAKYDHNFDIQFIEQFGTPSFDSVQGLAIGSDGYVLVSGHSQGNIETGGPINDSESGTKGFVVKFSSEGQVRWKKMYSAVNFWKILAPVPYSFFVAGGLEKEGKNVAVTYQIGLDGKIKSKYIFPASVNSFSTGFDVDSRRNIYITGHLEGNFTSASKIPPFKSETGNGSNIFVGIFDSISSKLLYSTVFGEDDFDINPKIAVSDNGVPHICYYSIESMSDSSGSAHMTLLERDE